MHPRRNSDGGFRTAVRGSSRHVLWFELPPGKEMFFFSAQPASLSHNSSRTESPSGGWPSV